MEPEPRLAFVHADAVPWTEVIAQLHGERRVSVHEKFLEWNAKRMVVLGRYDPHVVIERHGHASDHKEEYYTLLRERGIVRLPNPTFQKPPGAPTRADDGKDRWS